MIREGTYNSLLQGVSQQIPQEREDGQLGLQVNMLSDAVTGLRRRSGFKFHSILNLSARSYIEMVEFLGEQYTVYIDPDTGVCSVRNFTTNQGYAVTDDYYKASDKSAYRTTMARNQLYIVNTEKVPELINPSGVNTSAGQPRHPHHFGYAVILSSSFSRTFTIRVSNAFLGKTYTATMTTSDSTADQATPQYVAQKLRESLIAQAGFTTDIECVQDEHILAFAMKDWENNTAQLVVETSMSDIYVVCSNAARASQRTLLAARLPSMLYDFIMAVGTTSNPAYYQYQSASRTWTEVGEWSPYEYITDTPRIWYINNDDVLVHKVMDIQVRKAGNDENNPDPQFLGYGITGIGSYQSRLVLLSGAYVHFSKTNEFNVFYRTSVTELLDDDPIEISSASLASAQFEYCIPYNKDLILIAQGHQAVVPANTSVLTPKNAVIYPSNSTDLSLRAKPQPSARTLYYVYQRGEDYYQVGEFVPSSYTDAQYQAQNLTDHIPMYAQGICTSIATSTTNNMAVFTSDTNEILVNEYLWVGDDRPLMSFHKWELPYKVLHATFINDFLILYMHASTPRYGDYIVVGTMNTKTNQLDDKPAPYLDQYMYFDTRSGEPISLPIQFIGVPKDKLDVVIYDNRNLRHKSVTFELVDGGYKLTTPYKGDVAIGLKFKSAFAITPPFIKDDNGRVIAGERSIIHSLKMTFKHTGKFDVTVRDTFGESYNGEQDTALTWSEAALGYTWVNSVGSINIPCRTRLSSTECTVETDESTDLNLVTLGYVIRIAQKHRRL